MVSVDKLYKIIIGILIAWSFIAYFIHAQVIIKHKDQYITECEQDIFQKNEEIKYYRELLFAHLARVDKCLVE